MTRIMDATALKAFRESPELYRLRFLLHLVPQAREEAPESGQAFHAALRRWFDTYDVDEALAALNAAWAPMAVSEMFGITDPSTKRPLALFERLMRSYAERWPQAKEGFEIVRNESYVEGTFGGSQFHDAAKAGSAASFKWCGILDRKVRFPDGSEYIKDTKTTGAWLSKDFFAALDLDVQLPGYVGLELVNGRRCDGYIVDAIHVDTRAQKVDPARDFVRHGPVNVPGWKITRWAKDVEYTLRQIAQLEAERGINEPWPMYANFKFGKVGAYEPFFTTPPELHKVVAGDFAEREWKPNDR